MRLEFEGKNRYLGKWRGKIADTDDPNKQGRYRCVIPDIYGSDYIVARGDSKIVLGAEASTALDTTFFLYRFDEGRNVYDKLPNPSLVDEGLSAWALVSSPMGGGPDTGMIISFNIGDNVWVEFEQGMLDLPIIAGAWQSVPVSLLSESKNSPPDSGGGESNIPNISQRMKGDKRIEGVSPGISESSSSSATQYNKTFSYKTLSGHQIDVDDTPGSERILIQHRTGSYVELDPNGNIKLGATNLTQFLDGNFKNGITNNKIEIVGGNETKINKRNKVETIQGEASFNYKSKVTKTIEGRKDINIKGSVTSKIGGSKEERILNDYKSNVSGGRSETSGANKNVLVSGELNEVIGASASRFMNLGSHKIETIAGFNELISGLSSLKLSPVDITLDAVRLNLGSKLPLQPVPRGLQLLSYLGVLETFVNLLTLIFNTHTHVSTAPGSPVGPALPNMLITPIVAPSIGSQGPLISSTKVFID